MVKKDLFCSFIALFCGHVYGMNYVDMERLYNNLTANYNKNLRPTYNLSEPIIVGTNFWLLSIKEFEEKNSKLSIVGIISIYWIDWKMTWDPEDFGGIETFLIPQKEVWKPEIILANPYNNIIPLGDERLQIRVRYDGLMNWQPGDVYEVTCAADVSFYPFDEHTCYIEFTSWMYIPNSELNMYAINEAADLSLYTESGLWELKDTALYVSTNPTYAYLAVEIKIQRRPMFSIINILIPINVMGLLNVLVFILPADSGERVGFSITVLLAMTVFLTIVSDNLPNTSQPGISRLCYILMSDLILSTLMTICVIFGLRLHHKPEEKHVPLWLQRVTCLRRKNERKKIKYVYRKNGEQLEENYEYYNDNNLSRFTVPSIHYSQGAMLYTGRDHGYSKRGEQYETPQTQQFKERDISDVVDHEGETDAKWKDVAQFFDVLCFILFLLLSICKIAISVCIFIFSW